MHQHADGTGGRPAWRRSGYSGGNGGQCVEVAGLTDMVAVRDSKNPAGPMLEFIPGAWAEFLGGVKSGEFDR